MNWTQDSWSREENVVATSTRPSSPYAYGSTSTSSGRRATSSGSGNVEPRPGRRRRRRGASLVHARARRDLAHRIAKRIGQAKRRVRIASPVLSSGPILGDAGRGRSRREGATSPASSTTRRSTRSSTSGTRTGTRAGRSRRFAACSRARRFTGKPSTPWAPDTVHDFMHAKVTVADDIVFIGSFNLSHSGEMNAENVLEIGDADDRRPDGDVHRRDPRAVPAGHAAGDMTPAGASPLRSAALARSRSCSRLGVAVAVGRQSSPAGAPGCPVFPATNPWNQRVDKLPVAAELGSDRRVDRRRRPHARRLRLGPLGRRADRDPDHGRRQAPRRSHASRSSTPTSRTRARTRSRRTSRSRAAASPTATGTR